MFSEVEVAVPGDEAPARHPGGLTGGLATTLCGGLSLYALGWVLFVIQPQVYRVSFLVIALVLTVMLLPLHRAAFQIDLRAPGPIALAFGQELLVGAVLGLAARLTISALQVAGSIVASESFAVTTPNGTTTSDNPRFQVFPHESATQGMLIETGGDLCTNCHQQGQ